MKRFHRTWLILGSLLLMKHGQQKLALVSVDLVGLFLAPVERVRTCFNKGI